MDAHDVLVSVENLSHRFGKKQALEGVSLEIVRGRVFGLVGENGAGKTTLVKHLLGALTPQSGDARVFGIAPTRNPPAVLSRIGYLSEDRDLPRWMRIRELLRYTRAFYPNWDDAYAEELRAQFRLPVDAKVKNLSRGELAKAGLLVALAHRPELLLLDEPSSGLDAVARRDILAVVVRSVAEEGRTVLFSSHLLDEVERVADDVAMIHDGRVVLRSTVDELRATHQRLVVRFEAAQDAFPAIPGLIHAEGEGAEWAIIAQGDAEMLRTALAEKGGRIVEASAPSLDSIFIARVTGGRQTTAAA